MADISDENSNQDRRKSDLFREPAKREAEPKALAALRPAPRPLAAVPSTFELSDMQAEASFRSLVRIVRRQWWKLAAFVVASVIATGLVTSHLTPLYESTVAINVERRGSGVVGQQASAPTLSEMDQIMMTQIELIESDLVLRPVAEKYGLLDMEKQARWLNQEERERLRKSRTVLKRLKVARAPNTSILRISYRAPDPNLAADIATMIAGSYVEHAFDSREQSNAAVLSVVGRELTDLKENMISSDQALEAFAKDLGFVDPEQRASALTARLLQLNSDYTSAQSERLHKEAIFDAAKSGSLAIAQVSAQGSMLDTAITRLNQSKGDFTRISTVFGESHPEYQKAWSEMSEARRQFDETRDNAIERIAVDYRQAVAREQMTHDLLATTRTEVDGLTSKSFSYQHLKNEAENYRKLYDDLQRVTREQAINRGFQGAILQVIDPARPSLKQASPRMFLNLFAATFLASLLGSVAIVLVDLADSRIRSPEDAARLPNVDVLAAMPRFGSAFKGRKERCDVVATMPRNRRTRLLLEYQEFIRALRNAIISATLDGPCRSLVLTSPCENEHASTVISNLAFSYAILGRKVLVIDADVRDPSLHRSFEKSGGSGFAEVMAGEKTVNQTLIRVAREDLFLMPAGTMTDSSSDLISTGIGKLLDAVSQEFELVLILAPPLLAAPESVLLAGAADGVLVMARADATSSSDITAAYSLLQRHRANIVGMVVNDVKGLTKPKLFAETPGITARAI